MKLWQIALVSCSLGIGLPAFAQMVDRLETRTAVEAQIRERLGKFDANGDGVVGRDEFLAYGQSRAKDRAVKLFGDIDADSDGQISRAEFDGYYAKRAEGGLVEMTRVGSGSASEPIVIADMVKNALARFDAADSDKNGTLSAMERRAARSDRGR